MNPHLSLKATINCLSATTRIQNGQLYSGICRFLCSGSIRNSLICNRTTRFLHTFPGAANSMTGKQHTVIFSRKYKSLARNVQIYLIIRENGRVREFSASASSLGVDKSISAPLTKRQAQDLILRLTGEERSALLCALQEFEAEKMKTEYEVPPPTTHELWRVGLHNALPFIGFGFLDNFFMILFGDTIEMTVGTMMVLSTMAAAALGNTISDVLGIGSAWYVERMACKVGMRPPELTPIQLDMVSARIATNMGRVVGVIIGCLCGMLPLLFLNTESEKKIVIKGSDEVELRNSDEGEKKEGTEKKPT